MSDHLYVVSVCATVNPQVPREDWAISRYTCVCLHVGLSACVLSVCVSVFAYDSVKHKMWSENFTPVQSNCMLQYDSVLLQLCEQECLYHLSFIRIFPSSGRVVLHIRHIRELAGELAFKQLCCPHVTPRLKVPEDTGLLQSLPGDSSRQPVLRATDPGSC